MNIITFDNHRTFAITMGNFPLKFNTLINIFKHESRIHFYLCIHKAT